MQRVREYKKETGTDIGTQDFFDMHGVNRSRLYQCDKLWKIWANYYSKLKLMGVDVDSAVITEGDQK